MKKTLALMMLDCSWPHGGRSAYCAGKIGLGSGTGTQGRSQKDEPTDAWLKVKYRYSWFYIDANDVQSRASFTLLDAIFASVVGNIPGAKPLLTLPVK